MKVFLAVLLLSRLTSWGTAATELRSWHSYGHRQDGRQHYSYWVNNYKRGIFFGSCGPSTRSLQWSFLIDLKGKGPVYNPEDILIQNESKGLMQPIKTTQGTIRLDAGKKHVTIDLLVIMKNKEEPFQGNGIYSIPDV